MFKKLKEKKIKKEGVLIFNDLEKLLSKHSASSGKTGTEFNNYLKLKGNAFLLKNNCKQRKIEMVSFINRKSQTKIDVFVSFVYKGETFFSNFNLDIEEKK